MTQGTDIATHWGTGDVFGRILEAMRAANLSPDTVTVEQLAPIDHFHARGFPATVDLADALPVHAGHRLVDIGCGLGGPARYFAKRFGCTVSGIDITPAFVDAGTRLTDLVGLGEQVDIRLGDGNRLPYSDADPNTGSDAGFDGAITQHVTMNVEDRDGFFAEAFRVLNPGAFLALTEHGLGPAGDPFYPLPWSEDGSGAYLIPPATTVASLERAGFERITVEDTGERYLAGYRKAIALAERGELPPFGIHMLMGASAAAKTRNAARNIAEQRTHPIQVICFKP